MPHRPSAKLIRARTRLRHPVSRHVVRARHFAIRNTTSLLRPIARVVARPLDGTDIRSSRFPPVFVQFVRPHHDHRQRRAIFAAVITNAATLPARPISRQPQPPVRVRPGFPPAPDRLNRKHGCTRLEPLPRTFPDHAQNSFNPVPIHNKRPEGVTIVIAAKGNRHLAARASTAIVEFRT